MFTKKVIFNSFCGPSDVAVFSCYCYYCYCLYLCDSDCVRGSFSTDHWSADTIWWLHHQQHHRTQTGGNFTKV